MKKEDKIITLAIHSKRKALVLKQVLENRGITVCLEELPKNNGNEKTLENIAVKVRDSQVAEALTIVEEYKLFSDKNASTSHLDDGRRRVLVAVDFSSYSMQACQLAFSLAKEIDAKIKILHVYSNIYYPSHIPFADLLKEEGEMSILDKARRKMLDLCIEIDKKISEHSLPSVNYSYSLREGIVEEEIESFIDEYKPSLLIIGMRGKSNKRTNLIGGVTADIIEMTDVPVLAVPENSPIVDIRDIHHLAFFTNLHKRDIISFDYLASFLLPYHGLKVTLVHVKKGGKDEFEFTETQLIGLQETFAKKYPGLNISYKLIPHKDSAQEIKDFIEDENVNIVTVNTKRRSLFGRIFLPSTSRKILSTLNVTLLALRGEQLADLR